MGEQANDLGTYYVRVEFENLTGFLYRWETGQRYCGGAGGAHPLNAKRIGPAWETEDDIAEAVEFMFTDGNYACDCNRRQFSSQAQQHDVPDYGFQCGDETRLLRLTLIRPDGSERVVWEARRHG